MMNAVETAWVKVGGSWLQVAKLEWCTVTWLEQVNGKWDRKPDMNVIKEGSIFGLEMNEPTTMF